MQAVKSKCPANCTSVTVTRQTKDTLGKNRPSKTATERRHNRRQEEHPALVPGCLDASYRAAEWMAAHTPT